MKKPELKLPVIRPHRLAFAIRAALGRYTPAIYRAPNGTIHQI
jgi:hypothetical protein